MPNSPINVLIIGAGTGGLCLAQGLKPPELYQTLLATCAQPPVYANQLTHRMKFLFSAGPEVLKEGDQPPEADRDESVSRMTLRQVLLTGVEDVVHFDKVFSHYEQHPDGTVTACFEDGTSATGDVLVAADGANSRVPPPVPAARSAGRHRPDRHHRQDPAHPRDQAGPLGGFARAGMRTGMRVMNHLPAVKRKLVASESTFRGAGRDEEG